MVIQREHGMTDDEYFRFCAANRDLRIERTAGGEVLIAPPVGGESSFRNCELTGQLRNWARQDGRGRVRFQRGIPSRKRSRLFSGCFMDSSLAARQAEQRREAKISPNLSGFRG